MIADFVQEDTFPAVRVSKVSLANKLFDFTGLFHRNLNFYEMPYFKKESFVKFLLFNCLR